VSPKDSESKVKPIESPSGLDLHPKPESSPRVSRRAIGLVLGTVLAILLAYAYGGYRRTAKDEAVARQAGLPKAVAPATQAGMEFVNAVAVGDAPLAKKTELQPPADSKPVLPGPCSAGSPGSPYRYDPQTGQPCLGPHESRVVVRQPSPRVEPVMQTAPTTEPTPEERAAAAAYQREQEAILSPTVGSSSSSLKAPAPTSTGSGFNSPESDLSQILRHNPSANAAANTARSSAVSNDDYEVQNMQIRKESFLAAATQPQSDNYLHSIRAASLSRYEIKAGWEIPAILEQNLNSDLPGELKALVTSNVYDTATGNYLLIPQGARLIGRYDSGISYGQDGVQVVWNRIVFPDASSIDLNGMVGLDSHGNAGLRDKVDRHYRRLIGFSLLTSLFTAAFAISQERNESVLVNPSPGQLAAGAVGQELSQTGSQITRRNLNVQPTIKVPAGLRFTVRVNRDILFEAPYEPLEPAQQPAQVGR
jgi:type IV secretory pathway VirB10-like protein